MLANGDVDAGAGGIVSRSAALASYLRAKAHHETAKQDRDRLHNSVRAHLSLFNCNAEVPVIAHDLVVNGSRIRIDIEQSAVDGVGGLLWPCGQVLADLILDPNCTHLHRPVPANHVGQLTYCELGCGAAALPSMAVVSAYASTVYATDTDEILPIAERNLMHNLAKLSPVGTLTLMPRDWADENSEAVTADVVLAADVLYAERLYKPLAATIARILRPNGGVLLMTYCQRAPVNEELFLNGLLSDIGISHAEIDRRELCGQVIVTIRGVRSTQLSTDVHSQNLRSICAEEVVGEVAGIYL